MELENTQGEVEVTTSRRRLIKRMSAGAAGLGAMAFVASLSANPAAASNSGEIAVTGIGGTDGYGGEFSAGLSPLHLVPSASAGKPTAMGTGRAAGEFYVDSAGDLYYLGAVTTATSTGIPTWRRVSGAGTAGSYTLLPLPTRVIDTRPGKTNLSTVTFSSVGGTPTSAFAAGETRTYTVAGVTGTNVPAGATGIAASITATNPSMPSGSTGYFTIFSGPAAPVPAISNVTYNAAGIANAGFFQVALTTSGTAGQLNIFTFRGTDVIVDVVGYFL